ncbi:MAG: FMN-binding protein [Melioribacteraceae bacterium]|nr:MAG: FMN-binding protein [Melioribacteraceae bacterium]
MKTVIQMLITLTIIGVISGGLLSEISKWADPQIAEHRKEETAKAIYLVQPSAKSYEAITEVGFEVYKVFDENKNQIGFALPYEGNGFQGKVRLMVGLNNDLNEVIGLQVLEQLETPGLGTKITEEPFLKQFLNLSTLPQVDWVKGAPPSNPNEIQTITGATISSKAVVTILNDGIKKLREANNSGGAK